MTKHDPNIAARFAIFRKKYIAKGQVEAAKLLGVSQSKISDIESGKQAMDFNLANKIAQMYQLNMDWLGTGRGNLQNDEPESQDQLNINALLLESKNIQDYVIMNQAAMNHIVNVISKLADRIAQIEHNQSKKSTKLPR